MNRMRLLLLFFIGSIPFYKSEAHVGIALMIADKSLCCQGIQGSGNKE